MKSRPQLTVISGGRIESTCISQMSIPIGNLGVRRHFDLGVARDIVRGTSGLIDRFDLSPEGARWLDLTGYDTYADDAVAKLVQSGTEFNGVNVGFRTLSPDTAKAFTALRTGFFGMSNLVSLESHAARCLKWPRGLEPIRAFTVQEPLSAESASALVIEEEESAELLELVVPSIDVDVATILARHNHDLCLTVRTETLSPKVAEALANHAGHTMTLEFVGAVTDEVMKALASNPLKRIEGLRQYVRTETLTPKVADSLANHAGYTMTMEFDSAVTDEVFAALASNPIKSIQRVTTPEWSRVYVVPSHERSRVHVVPGRDNDDLSFHFPTNHC